MIARKVVFLCLIFLYGCGLSVQDGTDEKSLLGKVKLRWAALVVRDYEKMYMFTTPSYRKLYSLKDYKKKYNSGVVDWVSQKVISTEMYKTDPLSAKLRVKLRYKLALPTPSGVSFGKTMGVINAERKELWIVDDDEWWFVEG